MWVPAHRSTGAEQPARRPSLGGANNANLDSRSQKTPVEVSTGLVGVRSLAVDDEPDADTFQRLRDQRLGEPLTDIAGAEAELVDVHGGRRGRDVGQHRRIELLSFDEDLDRRRRALLERECEVAKLHRPRCEALGVPAQTIKRHVRRTRHRQCLSPTRSMGGDDSCVIPGSRTTFAVD